MDEPCRVRPLSELFDVFDTDKATIHNTDGLKLRGE